MPHLSPNQLEAIQTNCDLMDWRIDTTDRRQYIEIRFNKNTHNLDDIMTVLRRLPFDACLESGADDYIEQGEHAGTYMGTCLTFSIPNR